MARPPSATSPIVDREGRLNPSWFAFFAALTANPEAIVPVTPPGSPFAYTAPQRGHVMLTGGSVSGVSLTRGRVSVPVPVSGAIPVGPGDTVTITYSAAPAVAFIPG